MRTLGRKSVASVLKQFITGLFYLEFLLFLLLPLVFMSEKGLRYSWPVTINNSSAQPAATADNLKITGFIFRERTDAPPGTREQVLSFEDGSTGRKLLQTLHNVVTICIIILVTWWLKQLFTMLANNKPFARENSKRVQWIGWTVLLIPFFDLVESLLARWYTTSTINLSGSTFDVFDYSFDIRTFLIGVVLLIIAEILKRGYGYQSDSESIL